MPVRVSCSRLCALALSLFGCQCLFNISLLTSCRVCERVCVGVWERVCCLLSFRCLACSSFTLFAFRCWISLKFAPICHNLYFFLPFFFAIFRVFFIIFGCHTNDSAVEPSAGWRCCSAVPQMSLTSKWKNIQKRQLVFCAARVACRERERQRERQK